MYTYIFAAIMFDWCYGETVEVSLSILQRHLWTMGKMGNTSLGRLFREETFIRDLKDEYEVPRGNVG